MVHLLAWDHSQLTAAITPTWVLFSIFSPVCSHLHGIPKLPLPTCCLGELWGVMDLFMKCFVYSFYHGTSRRLVIIRKIYLLYWFFQKRELIILLLGKIFTIWKLPPKLKRFIFTIRFCFFSLQLKDVSISFWGRIIIICKIENFPYKFSLLKGGWFSFIPVV